MAIRDFGTSLLANVRARKDAGQAEARKYADKQQNKTIFKTLALQAAGSIGKEIFASINAGTAQKTEDFLARSELQNNKIKVTQFEKELGVSITERKAAKDKDITLTNYYAQDFADKQLAQARIDQPEKYLAGNDSFWKASFMKLPEIQAQAKKRAERNELIYGSGTEFTAGRASGRTLETLASRESTSFPRTIIQRLSKNVSTVDSFNDAMGSLTQVKIATKLYGITKDKLKLGREVAAETGDIALGVQAATGLRLDDDKRKEVLANIAKGYKTEYAHTSQIDGQGYLRTIQIASTLDNKGDVVGSPVITSEILGSNEKPATYTEVLSAIGKTNTVHTNVLTLVGREGYKDFLREATKKGLMPDTMEIKDHVKLNIFAMNPNNYTSAKNIIQELTEVESAFMIAYLKASPNLMRDIDNPQNPEIQKTYSQLLNGLTLVLRGARTAQVEKTEPTPDDPKKPSWAPSDSTWSKSRKGWVSNEPNEDGDYEMYTESD